MCSRDAELIASRKPTVLGLFVLDKIPGNIAEAVPIPEADMQTWWRRNTPVIRTIPKHHKDLNASANLLRTEHRLGSIFFASSHSCLSCRHRRKVKCQISVQKQGWIRYL